MREHVIEIEGLVPESVTIALKADLTIGEDLEGELNTVAALYGYYAVMAERAFTRLRRAETHFEMWEAQQVMHFMRSKEKPDPKWMIDADVKTLPKWHSYRDRICKYEGEAKILRAVASAFENKIKCVQTKNANRRKELS
jgi:hypothetical protein